MRSNLQKLVIIAATAFCSTVHGQQTYKFNDAVLWTYKTISELHRHAEKHLEELDKKIADKESAAKSAFNLLFKDQAKRRLEELRAERTAFLNSTWNCPYLHQQMCWTCKGTGWRWLPWPIKRTCGDCNGRRTHLAHRRHENKDSELSCDPPTIRDLLKVKE